MSLLWTRVGSLTHEDVEDENPGYSPYDDETMSHDLEPDDVYERQQVPLTSLRLRQYGEAFRDVLGSPPHSSVQPRIDELKTSPDLHNPLVVTKRNGFFELHDGFHRAHALHQSGQTHAEALVRRSAMEYA